MARKIISHDYTDGNPFEDSEYLEKKRNQESSSWYQQRLNQEFEDHMPDLEDRKPRVHKEFDQIAIEEYEEERGIKPPKRINTFRNDWGI